MRSPKQRVEFGIQWLDTHEELGNWRNKINIDKLRFANPDKGPLGQIFGDYLTGLKKMRIVGGGTELGFRNGYKQPEDCKHLKEAWAYALRTDTTWRKFSHHLARKVHGITYVISPYRNIFSLTEIKTANIKSLGLYRNIESAKRAVRKLSRRG